MKTIKQDNDSVARGNYDVFYKTLLTLNGYLKLSFL